MFYQKITDIFAECSVDYDKNSDTAITFYKTIQNKFHYAITGKTAAEIIYDRVDVSKENMGLTTWEKSPDGRRFIKSKELSDAFSQTEAYSEIFMELALDDKAATDFINGILPTSMK